MCKKISKYFIEGPKIPKLLESSRFWIRKKKSKAPLFSFQMLWDQVTVVVLQGHFSLGGFVPRVRTESEAVGGRHHATRGLGGGEHTCKRQSTHIWYLRTLKPWHSRICGMFFNTCVLDTNPHRVLYSKRLIQFSFTLSH